MQTQELSCMEVWGGNHPTLSAFEKSGMDVWLFSRPCDQSAGGGDTYYLSSCASGRITRMLLADISGHGEAVSDVAIKLRNLMRKHINQVYPKKLFEKINGEFTTEQQNEQFATAILHSYFAPSRKLKICNAGHPAPFVYRSGNGEWTPIRLSAQGRLQDLPFGIVENSDYQEFEIDFSSGDLLFSYTDGLADLEIQDGSLLGLDGIRECLEQSCVANPQAIVDQFIAHIQSAAGRGQIHDDISILLVRANSKGISVRDNLLSPFRWLGSFFANAD